MSVGHPDGAILGRNQGDGGPLIMSFRPGRGKKLTTSQAGVGGRVLLSGASSYRLVGIEQESDQRLFPHAPKTKKRRYDAGCQ